MSQSTDEPRSGESPEERDTSGEGIELTSTEEPTSFEPEEDPEGATEDDDAQGHPS